MTQWNTICQLLSISDLSDELKYQKAVKTIIFMLALHWPEQDIDEQKSMRIGSTDRLVPDIIVNKDGTHQFIVEFKRPGHARREKDIDQLISYMRQLETSVGVYVGDILEVYYKVIGDGSDPELVLCTRFSESSETGEDFIELFACDKFSTDRIVEYLESKKAKKLFDEKVEELKNTLISPDNFSLWKVAIATSLIADGMDGAVVEAAMDQTELRITPIKNIIPTKASDESPLTIQSTTTTRQRRSRKDPNSAQRYGYNLVRKIVEKNPGKTFDELFAIFRYKNHIIRKSEITENALHRWCLDDDDLITLDDGTVIAISNQWGFNNKCKPRLDNLRNLAIRYGIED